MYLGLNCTAVLLLRSLSIYIIRDFHAVSDVSEDDRMLFKLKTRLRSVTRWDARGLSPNEAQPLSATRIPAHIVAAPQL
jgi:hypothetical protein